MKGRIIITILVPALLVGGLFLPTKSGLTDANEPNSNPLTVFSQAEEEAIAEEESKAQEEKQAEHEESVSGLSENEQIAYAWAALRSEPESILLMRDRIADLNKSWNDTCGRTDILEVPEWTKEESFAVLTSDQKTLADAASLGLTQTVYDTLVSNQNLDGAPRDLRLGIILDRTTLKMLPGTKAPDTNTVFCSMPVWILHPSTDGAWDYVQTAYGRGWISSEKVAFCASKDVWMSYASPESRIVVTTPEMDLEGVKVDPGDFFSCLEENSDSYTVLLPIRKNDGSLDAKQVEISREDSSFGFVDYTWTRLYKQIYRINDTKTGLSTDDMIRSIYRTFGIDLPSDLAASFEDLGTMTELASLSGDERENTMNTIPMPALIEDANGIALMLGRKDGLWQCLRVVEGKAMIVEIEEPQRMVIIK